MNLWCIQRLLHKENEDQSWGNLAGQRNLCPLVIILRLLGVKKYLSVAMSLRFLQLLTKHWPTLTWWGKDLFDFHFPNTVHHWGMPGQELSAGTEGEAMSECCLLACSMWLLSLITYATSNQVTRKDTSYSELGSLMSIINQEQSTDLPESHPGGNISSVELPSSRWLSSLTSQMLSVSGWQESRQHRLDLVLRSWSRGS